jgi:hypothetical protein
MSTATLIAAPTSTATSPCCKQISLHFTVFPVLSVLWTCMHLPAINTLYVQTGTISLILTLVSTCLLHSSYTHKLSAFTYAALS